MARAAACRRQGAFLTAAWLLLAVGAALVLGPQASEAKISAKASPSPSPASSPAPGKGKGRCKRNYGCPDGAIVALECCVRDGCVINVRQYYAKDTTPPKDALCTNCTSSDTVSRIELNGEIISNYSVQVQQWGGALKLCVSSMTFVTQTGRTLTCGSSNSSSSSGGSGRRLMDAAAVEDDDVLATGGLQGPRRSLLTSPRQPAKAKPGKVPACMRSGGTEVTPYGQLCSLKVRRCRPDQQKVSAINYITPSWSYSGDRCAIKPSDITWSCASNIGCPTAGAPFPLSGVCKTDITAGKVIYSVGGAVVSSLTCPSAGATISVTPSLLLSSALPAACQSSGPTLAMTLGGSTGGGATGGGGGSTGGNGGSSGGGGTGGNSNGGTGGNTNGGSGGVVCDPPVLTCARPACSTGGSVDLQGTCQPVDGFSWAYVANGVPVTGPVVCPAPGTPLAVAVKPVADTDQGCFYSSVVVYELDTPSNDQSGGGDGGSGSPGGPSGGGVGCPSYPDLSCTAPTCAAQDDLVAVDGSCVPSDPNVKVTYYVQNVEALMALCPAPGVSLPVAVVPSYPAYPNCTFPESVVYEIALPVDPNSSGSGGTNGTDSGSGGTNGTDSGSGGTNGTDSGSGGTNGTDSGSGGTNGTDSGSGGTNGTDSGSGGTNGTDSGSGGTGGTDSGTGGTNGTDSGSGGTGGPPGTGGGGPIVINNGTGGSNNGSGSPSPPPPVTCPDTPTITCSPPVCSHADETAVLDGTCSSPTATSLVYLVDGVAKSTVPCPQPNVPLAVTVTPVIATSPTCLYNATAAYTLTTTCASKASASADCPAANVPVCQHMGQVLQLTNVCTTNVAGAQITYTIDGADATTVTCPYELGAAAVSVTPVVAGPNGCTYGSQAPFLVQPFECPSSVAYPVTCSAPPPCQYAGEVLQLPAGLCTMSDGTPASLVDAIGATVTTVVCPALGSAVQLTPTATLNGTGGQCKYVGSRLDFLSTCPAKDSVKFNCPESVTCPFSGASMPLAADLCTIEGLPNAVATYRVGGQVGASASCADPGSSQAVGVAISVEGYQEACDYAGPTVAVTSSCKGPEFSTAFQCTAPRCTVVGADVPLADSCTAPEGAVRYFDAAGAEVTSVKCPAPDAGAVVVEPRIVGLGAASCAIKGAPYSVTAPMCPDASTVNLACTPAACVKAGANVSLVGTCTSTASGAGFKYEVDGADATWAVCPAPGVSLRVEPTLTSVNGLASCSYPSAGYSLTSECPPEEAASLSCGNLACSAPGAVVPLDGLCSTTLPGASVHYIIDGGDNVTESTNMTCPQDGETVSVSTFVRFGDRAACTYRNPPITVTTRCSRPATPLLSCSDIVCPTAGASVPLAGVCTSVGGGEVSYEIDACQAGTYTCPAPGTTTTVKATLWQNGCEHRTNFTVKSTCWSRTQAQPACRDTACGPGQTSVASLAASCSTPLSSASWGFAPSAPFSCPLSGQTLDVSATLTVQSPLGASCTYTTIAKIVGTSCTPGQYKDTSTGACAPCGIGYFCPDGVERIKCIRTETTAVTNATHMDDCFPIGGTPGTGHHHVGNGRNRTWYGGKGKGKGSSGGNDDGSDDSQDSGSGGSQHGGSQHGGKGKGSSGSGSDDGSDGGSGRGRNGTFPFYKGEDGQGRNRTLYGNGSDDSQGSGGGGSEHGGKGSSGSGSDDKGSDGKSSGSGSREHGGKGSSGSGSGSDDQSSGSGSSEHGSKGSSGSGSGSDGKSSGSGSGKGSSGSGSGKTVYPFYKGDDSNGGGSNRGSDSDSSKSSKGSSSNGSRKLLLAGRR